MVSVRQSVSPVRSPKTQVPCGFLKCLRENCTLIKQYHQNQKARLSAVHTYKAASPANLQAFHRLFNTDWELPLLGALWVLSYVVVRDLYYSLQMVQRSLST